MNDPAPADLRGACRAADGTQQHVLPELVEAVAVVADVRAHFALAKHAHVVIAKDEVRVAGDALDVGRIELFDAHERHRNEGEPLGRWHAQNYTVPQPVAAAVSRSATTGPA